MLQRKEYQTEPPGPAHGDRGFTGSARPQAHYSQHLDRGGLATFRGERLGHDTRRAARASRPTHLLYPKDRLTAAVAAYRPRGAEVEPAITVFAVEDNHLPTVNGGQIRTALGRKLSRVNASPAPSGIGRHRPAKQNQSSPAFFDFGDLVPVNSKKCDAGARQLPFGKVALRSEN
jgi:hypothetical protein